MPDSQSVRAAGSIDAAIHTIRSARDKAINDLFVDNALDEFLETHFSVFVISKVKREFICRDLISLRNASLDLVHYAELIKSGKDNPHESAAWNDLLLKELFVIFAKYGFEK
jgi:hypothetical protein